MTGLLLTFAAAVLMGTVIDALAMVGVLIWATGWLMLVPPEASRRVHRRLDRRPPHSSTDHSSGTQR